MFAPATIDRSSRRGNLGTRRGLPRGLIVAACVLVAVPAFYAILFTLYWPFTKQDVIDVLQERSLRTVTIDQFHNTYFPPGCIAKEGEVPAHQEQEQAAPHHHTETDGFHDLSGHDEVPAAARNGAGDWTYVRFRRKNRRVNQAR